MSVFKADRLVMARTAIALAMTTTAPKASPSFSLIVKRMGNSYGFQVLGC
jgi:hypothetical protein